jgi:hypothetical protein
MGDVVKNIPWEMGSPPIPHSNNNNNYIAFPEILLKHSLHMYVMFGIVAGQQSLLAHCMAPSHPPNVNC